MDSRIVPPCSCSILDEFLEDGEIVPPKSIPTPDSSDSHDVDGAKKLPRQYLETILSTRYGIKPCSQSVLESLPSYEGVYGKMTLTDYEVRMYMAERNAQLQDEDHAASIRYIFYHVKESIPLPPELWDLHDSNVSLKNVLYPFRFICEDKFSPTVYRITPLNGRYLRPWTLVVPHATTVLQVVRNNWGPSLEDLTGEFVSLGIPFSTLELSSSPPQRLPRPRSVFEDLSRPSSFRPNIFTYRNYELRREDFLKHPHSRAALLRGGILWRLCKASFEGCLGLVNGPSADVRVFGEAIRFPSSTSNGGITLAAWDDTLTSDEVDLICGVYYVAAKDGDQKQWTTLSWWPRPNVFDKCGMWTGYWNSSCEIWFQQRLDSIHCGEAKPLKAKEWKSALRYHQKKTRQLCDLTEEASARFIGKVLG